MSVSLTRTSVLKVSVLSYGMVMPPDEAGNSRWSRSLKRASMFCSFHSCLTDSSVYLNRGTQRTLVNANRTRLPSLARAMTGMEPMWVALAIWPSALPKISSHGLMSLRREQSGVRLAVAPESGVAQMTGRDVDRDLMTAASEALMSAAWEP